MPYLMGVYEKNKNKKDNIYQFNKNMNKSKIFIDAIFIF
jgi:hypothetical protein